MAFNFKIPFIKVPKHQRFNYKPMHYDAAKEDLEKRFIRAESEQGDSIDAVKSRISSKLRTGGFLQDAQLKRKYQRKSSLITFGIVVILLILACLIIVFYLPEFIQKIEQG